MTNCRGKEIYSIQRVERDLFILFIHLFTYIFFLFIYFIYLFYLFIYLFYLFIYLFIYLFYLFYLLISLHGSLSTGILGNSQVIMKGLCNKYKLKRRITINTVRYISWVLVILTSAPV